MILKEKERAALEDLRTQEKSCVEKYERYADQAKDPELKSLFKTLQKEEQKHYDSLDRCLQERFRNVTVTTAQDITTSRRLPIMT